MYIMYTQKPMLKIIAIVSFIQLRVTKSNLNSFFFSEPCQTSRQHAFINYVGRSFDIICKIIIEYLFQCIL